jgi:hypothetical protein
MFMLLFTGCNNDHTAPHDNQQRKYAEVEYSEYAKDGMYIAKGKYIECPKDIMYDIEGRYGKYAKEDASIKEGHNEPLAKEGDNEPLAKDGNWLGKTMSPLPQGQLAMYVMQDNNEPLATKGLRTAYAMQGNNKHLTTIGDWATTFDDCEGAKHSRLNQLHQ